MQILPFSILVAVDGDGRRKCVYKKEALRGGVGTTILLAHGGEGMPAPLKFRFSRGVMQSLFINDLHAVPTTKNAKKRAFLSETSQHRGLQKVLTLKPPFWNAQRCVPKLVQACCPIDIQRVLPCRHCCWKTVELITAAAS